MCCFKGFLLKAQASKYKPSHWDFEAESLAIMGRAGLLFSIGIRCFFGFGILVSLTRSVVCHSFVMLNVTHILHRVVSCAISLACKVMVTMTVCALDRC